MRLAAPRALLLSPKDRTKTHPILRGQANGLAFTVFTGGKRVGRNDLRNTFSEYRDQASDEARLHPRVEIRRPSRILDLFQRQSFEYLVHDSEALAAR